MKIVSRKEAVKQGYTFYFTGVRCPNGHVAKRWVSNSSCNECLRYDALRDKSKFKPRPDLIPGKYLYESIFRNEKVVKKNRLPKTITDKCPADFRFVSYKYAQEIVNHLGIKSARLYYQWYEEYKPRAFPRNPWNTYDEWHGWAEFLKTDNMYKAYLPMVTPRNELMDFWEACNIVQSKKFKGIKEYQEAWDAGDIPKGIPRNPAIYANKFTDNGRYKNFLGLKIKHRINAAEQLKPILILYQANDQSPNVLSVIIHKTGVTSLMELIREKNINVVKLYYWYNDFAEHVFDMFSQYGHQQGDTSWLFNNTNEILYELDTVLEPFNMS